MHRDYRPRTRRKRVDIEREDARGGARCCEILLLFVSPSAVASYTYFLLAGLSYGARKHTQIRAQLPAGSGKSYRAFILRAPWLDVPDLEYRVKSLLRQLRIRISPVRTPSGGFSARCPPGCYFGSPESDFHFDGFLRISMGTSRTRRKFARCGPRESRGRVSRAARSKIHQSIAKKFTRPLMGALSRTWTRTIWNCEIRITDRYTHTHTHVYREGGRGRFR